MNCLTPDQIYLYLEKDLPPEEMNRISSHIASCQKCRIGLKERTVFMEAVESLPLLQVPPDFAQQVMARIFTAKSSVRVWIAGLATGFSLVIAIFLAAFLQSGFSLSELFIQLNRSLWTFISNLSVFFVKTIKIISLVFDLIPKLSGYIYTTLTSITSVVGIEVQVTLIALTILMSFAAYFGLRRKIWTGEKT
ncbi:MAG: zf-HC2 domain-containing protein [Candidatus Aminicenantes bacterium]|nr:zf-HC2 domain-containing protein [Candidatus Aminicenantes bacterium]